jgi:hypothetical protein
VWRADMRHAGIDVERDGGPVWLRITGEGNPKQILQEELGLDT